MMIISFIYDVHLFGHVVKRGYNVSDLNSGDLNVPSDSH